MVVAALVVVQLDKRPGCVIIVEMVIVVVEDAAAFVGGPPTTLPGWAPKYLKRAREAQAAFSCSWSIIIILAQHPLAGNAN